MALRLSTAARNAATDAVTALIDAGSGPGLIKVYVGAQPANVSDNPSGTLLATLTFTDPSFGPAVVGVATANPITGDASCAASGSAGHFTLTDSDGNVVTDGAIPGEMTFDQAAITAGGTLNLSSFTLTDPVS